MDLNGTAAVVSGGASGLGAATARALAAAGATVLIADLNADGGKRVADEIGGRFARTDVSDEAAVQAAVDAAATAGPPLRVAVSCAGIGWAARTVGRDGSPHDLASFQKVIAVNLVGTFNLMRIAAAAMARTEPAGADKQRGVIVNTASVAGIEGQTGQVAYSASKGGIMGMTVPAARDLSVIGVRVLTVCPGIIDTPIYGFNPNAEEFKARLVAPVVFPKRMGRPDEFGHLVRSLVENDYMNAEVIRFDGGIRFQPKLRPADRGDPLRPSRGLHGCCSIEPARGGAELVAGPDARLAVHFPPQHLGEEVFDAMPGPPAPPASPARHVASGPTRLVFSVPEGTRIAYTLEAILAALPGLPLKVPGAATPAGEAVAPSACIQP